MESRHKMSMQHETFTGDLGHGGGVELVRDGGHEHDEGGAQAEASQGEAGRGRHEQVRPG